MLPSGTVTFLFTDIEGSTKLAQQFSDRIHDFYSERQAMTLKESIALALQEL